MANFTDPYDPIFYAQEALDVLYANMGMAARVHRGYDKQPQQKGSTIQIRKPGTFAVQDAPSVAQDVRPEELSIDLDFWKEVKFALSDKELSATGQEIIDEHIEPAAKALADYIDQQLASLYSYVPWHYDASSPLVLGDITQSRAIMRTNKVALEDRGRIHGMVGSTTEAELLDLPGFASGDQGGPEGLEGLRRGSLATRFNIEFFANQNTPDHTTGTVDTTALEVNGAVNEGATTVNLDAVAVTGTLNTGDTFVIAGNTQRYSVIGGPYTAAGNAFSNVQIYPAAVQAYADDSAVTVDATSHSANLLFHRNAFALAMAPLGDVASRLPGVRVQAVSDDTNRLSLRSRVWYDADNSQVVVALDVLFGFRALDGNQAVRLRA